MDAIMDQEELKKTEKLTRKEMESKIKKMRYDTLQGLVDQLTKGQKGMFINMYGSVDVSLMPNSKIDWAIEQCSKTLKKNKGKLIEANDIAVNLSERMSADIEKDLPFTDGNLISMVEDLLKRLKEIHVLEKWECQCGTVLPAEYNFCIKCGKSYGTRKKE